MSYSRGVAEYYKSKRYFEKLEEENKDIPVNPVMRRRRKKPLPKDPNEDYKAYFEKFDTELRKKADWKNRNHFEILSEELLELLTSGAARPTNRDEIISSILESDRISKEVIRRLVIQESRLDVLVKILGLRLAPHHLAYIEFIRMLRERGSKRGLLLAPRGSGKSTICTICYIIMRLLQDPDLSVLLSSRTSDKAKSFLSSIKGFFIDSTFIDIFGDLRGNKWDELSISVKDRDPSLKEHSIHLGGADGSIVSKHFDLIVADDMVEEKNSKTEGQRNSIIRFLYKSLLPCLKAGGELWVYGTKYHPEDLYTYLEENDPSFKNAIMVYPGVFDKTTGKAVDLIQKPDGTFQLPENAQVWDEEGFPEKELLARRNSMSQGDFESQYQNRIDMLRGDYFSSDNFKYYDVDPATLVKENSLRVWAGVDLAISENEEADEFAIVIVGIESKTFNVYVLDYLSGRFSFMRQMELINQMFETWDPVKTYIESNAYQAALQQTTITEFPEVRAFQLYTTKDKITRAQSLSSYYELGKMYHRKNRMAKLEGQLTAFPNRKLKDLFDALYFAVWGAIRGGRRKDKKKKKFGVIG